MSKKTKHQKELIEHKLNNTTKELNQLESKYINLISTLPTLISTQLLSTTNSTITFKLNTNLKHLLYQTQQDYNNLNNNNLNNLNNTITKLNYDYFNKELTLLEQEKQTNKQLISGLTKYNNE